MEKSLAMQRLEKDKEPILIGIIAGSPSDKAKLMEVVSTLKDDLKFFSFAATYASAHRTPERLRAVVNGYLSRGCRVFIALSRDGVSSRWRYCRRNGHASDSCSPGLQKSPRIGCLVSGSANAAWHSRRHDGNRRR